MPKQDDKQPCIMAGCNGEMTYHEKLDVDPQADQPVRPSGRVGGRPDWNYSGWLRAGYSKGEAMAIALNVAGFRPPPPKQPTSLHRAPGQPRPTRQTTH